MVNNKQNMNTNYIIQTLYERGLHYFDIILFSHIFGISHLKSSQVFKNLEKKNFVTEVEKGKYLLLGFESHRVLSQPFFIGTKIAVPSYVSYWSALNFYGFTEQVPQVIFIANTKRKGELIFRGIRYKYVKIASRKFWGYKEIRLNGLSCLLADEEKAFIDSLDEPSYAGGIEEIFKCIAQAKDKINFERLFDYAKRFRNKSLNSRLGYFLENLNIDASQLKSYCSKSYVKIDSMRPWSKTWNTKWKVNENISERMQC
ncbi:hypothetical protein COS91_00745 [Candidatus Desantisbacteria bacterium CG07_land_8_20_14_0_80_39_15]|uniref:AbiEi antitoxin C-terminal domain-containing protein n=1 Tax=Candidatus Desantisbacteria bacterium CG07_land_8_20_14_0_80_39_15 TaxID=1974549 RepID=A0A2M6ZIC3_9BACT|nr:MAG: hypothetical protein COS91_00745 [Candidatus Desantisbacteria bacterium CG07_land_8_20_14_0_80_39_15]